jgi:hypothetical protein
MFQLPRELQRLCFSIVALPKCHHSKIRASIVTLAMLILVGAVKTKEHPGTKKHLVELSSTFLILENETRKCTIKAICSTSR